MGQLTSTVVAGDSYTLVTLAGESDLNTSDQLRDVLLAEADRDALRMIVELSGLSFIDSTGLGVLVDVYKRLGERGGELALVSPQPAVARVLTISGFARLARVYDSVEKASARKPRKGAR